MIDAAKRIIARMSSIIFWPFNILTRRVAKANRRMMRWAVRHRIGAVYLIALFWLVSGFLGNVGMQAVLKTMENPPSLSNKWIFVTIVRTVCAQISEDHQEISGEALFA
jgi:hypothetical protein